MQNLSEWIELFKKSGELRVIDAPVDIKLEMAHLAYAEAKKEGGGQALLFTRAIDGDRVFATPVLMNLYGSAKRVKMIFGCDVKSVANEVQKIVQPDHPTTLCGKIKKLFELAKLRKCFPKRLKTRGACQAKIRLANAAVKFGAAAKLSDLPILTTWSEDGGAFITMGQVYTRSIDGKQHNLGMYRLQVFSDRELGLHWQIHKDSSRFFHEYEKVGAKMPVSVAIGGDPLYTWCATAPLPRGIFELLLYGFIRKTPAKLVKCLTNDLFVPADADFVIEGWIENPSERKIEGKFGDHTGYYTPEEPYPFMTVSAITSRENPVFAATVVGKPPIEDKYMGYPTERIFLPLFRTTCPELIDYKMPENGVFHNLILAKLRVRYDGHALQAMHAFWGTGQMSFVKHAIFVGEDAPDLEDFTALLRWILDRFSHERLLISAGVLDALDHSSPQPLVGGKLGLDCTGDAVEKRAEILSDRELFARVKAAAPETEAIAQYGVDSANPIAVLAINKSRPAKEIAQALSWLKAHLSIVVLIDARGNDPQNGYMTLWRVCNNIDAKRDLILGDLAFLDATAKGAAEGCDREWPRDTDCDPQAVDRLRQKGLWEFDADFETKWQLFGEAK